MIDRIARVVLGLALLGLALIGGQWWGWIGFVPLATAAVGSVLPTGSWG